VISIEDRDHGPNGRTGTRIGTGRAAAGRAGSFNSGKNEFLFLMSMEAAPLWFPIYNAVVDLDRALELSIFHPRKADSSSASTVNSILGSCDALLQENNTLWEDEEVLIGRIIHRSKSQHRGCSYLRYLMQLKRLFRRYDQVGLSCVLSSALKATASSGATTTLSRQHLDLLLARMVSSGVLCARGIRLARVLFASFEAQVVRTFFMPLALACMAVAGRVEALLKAR
jgi:hypothetical protein